MIQTVTMRDARIVSALALATAIAGCADRPEGTRHPIIDTVAGQSAIHDDRRPVPGVEALQRRLARAIRVTQIGTLDGAPETVFANPTDVAVTSSGDILILDAGASEIRAFDEGGRFLRRIATSGEGPSELRNPVEMDLLVEPDGDGRSREVLVVSTRSLVKTFDLAQVPTRQLTQYAPPTIPIPEGVCASGGRIVTRVAFSRDSGIAAALNTAKREVTKFGQGYTHGGLIARQDLSLGPTVCMPDGDVILAFTFLPILRAYDSAGRPRWSASLPGFRPLVFLETHDAEGRVRFSERFDFAGDRLLTARPAPGSTIAVQVARLDAATPERPNSQRILRRRTYLISAASGEGAFISDSLPTLLGLTDTMFWAVEEAPEGYLRVVGYRY